MDESPKIGKAPNDGDGNSAAIRLRGVVDKIITGFDPTGPEKMQITIEGAEHLYREIRVPNTLRNAAGGDVKLEPGIEVDVIILARAAKEKSPEVGSHAAGEKFLQTPADEAEEMSA